MLSSLARSLLRASKRARWPGLGPAALGRCASQVVSIQPSATEVREGTLSERNLERAVRHVLQDGLVVVENAVDHDILDRLNAKMVADAAVLRDMKDKSPYNYNKGNLQQDAPPVKEWFAPEIFLSECSPFCRKIGRLGTMWGDVAVPSCFG